MKTVKIHLAKPCGSMTLLKGRDVNSFDDLKKWIDAVKKAGYWPLMVEHGENEMTEEEHMKMPTSEEVLKIQRHFLEWE